MRPQRTRGGLAAKRRLPAGGRHRLDRSAAYDEEAARIDDNRITQLGGRGTWVRR